MQTMHTSRAEYRPIAGKDTGTSDSNSDNPLAEPVSSVSCAPTFFPASTARRITLLTLMFAAGLGIRVYHLADPPLDFHPTRQYRSALLTRAFYLQHAPNATREQIDVANAGRPTFLEVPINEYIVAGLALVAGNESYVLGRIASITYWLVAAVCLYLLACRLLSRDAAIIAAAVFLFLPYVVMASRSFQPDPLMVMLTVMTLYAMVRYYERPGFGRLAAMAVLAAAAIFVKPVCVFMIWSAFLAGSWACRGMRTTISSPSVYIFLFVSVLPTAGYYGYNLLFGELLGDQARGSFLPNLWLNKYYWLEWKRMALRVVDVTLLAAALVGTLLVRGRLARGLLIGLWVGYVVFGLTFTYHIHTHDYYHLLLVIVVALGTGSAGALVLERLALSSRPVRTAAWAVMLLVLLVQADMATTLMNRGREHARVDTWKKVGELVNHSQRTVMLAYNYGNALKYHGVIGGKYWPWASDFRIKAMKNKDAHRGREKFDAFLARLNPEYFIVTALDELQRQPDLQEILRQYPLLHQTEEYSIYDLTAPSATSAQTRISNTNG